MDISAFSWQNKVTEKCPNYLHVLMIVLVPNADLANSNNIQNYQIYTMYTNMAGTRIVCPTYTVNFRR